MSTIALVTGLRLGARACFGLIERIREHNILKEKRDCHLLTLLLLSQTGLISASDRILDILPVSQITPTSCWLATGEMIFRYYHIPANAPNYQCGELRFQNARRVAPGGPMAFNGPCWLNCGPCAGISAGSVQGLVNMIVQYSAGMSIVTGKNFSLQQPQVSLTPLDEYDVVSEIDAGRPIIAGISPGAAMMPPGIAEHAVLIVGYQNDGSLLVVNDPFPYQSAGMTPPYVQFGGHQLIPGRFSIPYSSMTGPINWGNAVYQIRP
jgi:hypothetical protein